MTLKPIRIVDLKPGSLERQVEMVNKIADQNERDKYGNLVRKPINEAGKRGQAEWLRFSKTRV